MYIKLQKEHPISKAQVITEKKKKREFSLRNMMSLTRPAVIFYITFEGIQ